MLSFMKGVRKKVDAILRTLKALAYQPVVAAAVIWRRAALRRTTVIAITGSVGKSTTTDCLAAILSRLGPTVQTKERNGRQGIPPIILSARPSHRFLVLEAGILKPGRMWRSAFLTRPDVAVITAVNWQHARNFHSLDHIAAEKAKMLDGLPPGGLAVLNADDPRVAAMHQGRNCRVVTFGEGPAAQVRGRVESAAWPGRLTMTVSDAEGSRRIETRLVGAHWAPSVLAAIAAARSLGASWDQCAEALARTPPHTGRLEPVSLPSGAILLRDEYNGSWATLERALGVLAEAAADRKIVALGHILDAPDLGSDAVAVYARHVARVADVALVWGSHAERFQRAALAERPGMAVLTFDTQSDLADCLRRESRPGDLVLLKGYWFDHMSRIVYEQFGEVECKLPYCTHVWLCDECPKLGFQPSAGHPRSLLAQLPAAP